ncbi:g4268 [Coccomyxa elongata]
MCSVGLLWFLTLLLCLHPRTTLQVQTTEQWKGKLVPANKSQALTGLLEEVYQAEGTPARQLPVGITSLKGQAGKVVEYNVTCMLPSNLGDVSPVLLSELDGAAFEDIVVLTTAPKKLRRVAVFSADPEVGPLSGGTEVTLQGEGFSAPMSCLFSNGSFVQTVNAKVQSASIATCIVPSWPVISVNGTNGTIVDFKVAINNCLFSFSYGYYLNPMVKRVDPEVGPRYGSFPLTVFLEDSLELLTDGKDEMLRPTLRIEGATEDGGDLLLTANVTDDRRALMAITPSDLGPLTAGSHLLHVSLNGQFAGFNDSNLVVNVEGPSVGMEEPYIGRSINGGGLMEVGVELKGPNALPVTAYLTVAQRLLSPGGATVANVVPEAVYATLLSTDTVIWQPGENGRRSVMLHLPESQASEPPGALLVTVGNVSNADLTLEQSSTVISGIPSANLTTGFAVTPNQVAYPGDAVVVPIRIQSPLLRAPASVRYTIASTTGEDPSEYIPQDALEGVLSWDQDSGSSLNLTIPVNWTSVPPEAEYRLGVTLEALWRAVVDSPASGAVAMHLFGVQPDQCPPGSYRVNSTEHEIFGSEARPQPEWPVGQDARLRAIVVRGVNGTVFDLSSAFRPDVANYGVAVPPSFGNGSLCLLPIQDAASVDVYGPDGMRLEQRWVSKLGSGSSHNRRALLDQAEAPMAAAAAVGAPTPLSAAFDQAPASAPEGSSEAKTASGVAAMPAKGSAVTAAYNACRSRYWPLSLEPGQNQFTVVVTAPAAMAPLASRMNSSSMALIQLQGKPVNASSPSHSYPPAAGAPWRPAATVPSASGPARAMWTPGNHSEAYSVSVVQLADPAHAEMMQLNATTSTKESLCVCGKKSLKGGEGGLSKACKPNSPMQLNVSHGTEWVSLHPGLRWPGVPGLRVEVNGQVLSQGGDVSADQEQDTTAETRTRAQADFLPVALVLGLSPGVPVEVPIVVIAEDGVTSLRYFLHIVRNMPPANATAPASAASGGSRLSGAGTNGSSGGSIADGPSSGGLHFVRSGAGMGSSSEEKDSKSADLTTMLAASEAPLQPGWPVPPSRQPWCGTCPAGWATTVIDAQHCMLCRPGTYAAARHSPKCAPCANGTYAYSWGSTHCNHCIIGTYAPWRGSKLCMMCPTNTTNLEDGSYDCPVAVLPGASLAARYAVIVSFGVYLNGTSLEEIARKVGVNASSVAILEHLVRADTASAFNISVGDVNVTGISQVSRRVLYVNVTATLGVDVPPNASADDIKTALEVTNLSADDPIAMLAQNPDKFFGRTTKALDVTAEPDGKPPQRVEYRPGAGRSALAAAWPAIVGVGLAALLGGFAALHCLRRRSKRAARLYDVLLERCTRCRPSRRPGWAMQVNAATSDDASNVALSGAGLTARTKPASFIHVQDAEPMYTFTAYSDGQPRHAK